MIAAIERGERTQLRIAPIEIGDSSGAGPKARPRVQGNNQDPWLFFRHCALGSRPAHSSFFVRQDPHQLGLSRSREVMTDEDGRLHGRIIVEALDERVCRFVNGLAHRVVSFRATRYFDDERALEHVSDHRHRMNVASGPLGRSVVDANHRDAGDVFGRRDVVLGDWSALQGWGRL